jgi:hypothetical protein
MKIELLNPPENNRLSKEMLNIQVGERICPEA